MLCQFRTADQVSNTPHHTMWRPSNNNKVETEEEEESLAWNVVRKKRSKERGGKMRTEQPDRADELRGFVAKVNCVTPKRVAEQCGESVS